MILSILIPTKNRIDNLKVLLDYFVLWDSNDFEVIISDNSDIDNTSIINDLYGSENRIKYYHTNECLSGDENAERCLDYYSGEYVIFLGDDDIVSENVLNILRSAINQNIKLLVFRKCIYYWKGIKFKLYGKSFSGCAIVPRSNKRFYFSAKFDTKHALNRVSKSGATSILNLPSIYQSFVHFSVINAAKLRQKKIYFLGPAIDMSSIATNLLTEEEYHYLDVPLVVSGASVLSMAGRGIKKEVVDRLENEKTLPQNISQKWNNDLLKIWSPQTIWAQSFLMPMTFHDQTSFLSIFNFNRTHGIFWSQNISKTFFLFQELKIKIYSFNFFAILFYFSVSFIQRVESFVNNILIIFNIHPNLKKVPSNDIKSLMQKIIDKKYKNVQIFFNDKVSK